MEKEELKKLLEEKGFLKSEIVIKAFDLVDRKKFVPVDLKKEAYSNYPLPIGEGQTISQPLTVVAMTESLDVKKGMKVLEVGSGSGYQAAILSKLVGSEGTVVTVEIVKKLYELAKNNLKDYENVRVVFGDASKGYENHAPYDRIIVTADCPEVPEPLIEQLKTKGKMVLPKRKSLILVEKNDEIKETYLGLFSFVPLKGKYGYE